MDGKSLAKSIILMPFVSLSDRYLYDSLCLQLLETQLQLCVVILPSITRLKHQSGSVFICTYLKNLVALEQENIYENCPNTGIQNVSVLLKATTKTTSNATNPTTKKNHNKNWKRQKHHKPEEQHQGSRNVEPMVTWMPDILISCRQLEAK